MDNRRHRLIIVLLVLNIAASLLIAGHLFAVNFTGRNNSSIIEFEKGEKYTLYIGMQTDSRDISPVEAQTIIDEICVKYVSGFTSWISDGGWVDENGAMTRENSAVYTFYDATEEQIVKIMDEVMEKLDQKSILVEKSDTYHAFYWK